MSTYQPSRLTVARLRRGTRKNELAARLGVQPSVIAKYEKDEREPEFAVLQRLASILEVELDFFFRPEPPEVSPQLVTFRALSRMGARDQNRAVATAVLAIEIAAAVEELFQLPRWDASPPDLPDSHASSPEDIARALRAEWSLGDRKISNVVQLLESKGVRVFSLYDNPDCIDAFTYWHERLPFVFLNQQKTAQRSRFDACHELGHIILHRDADHTGKPAEVEANRFASAFLMPEEAVLATGVRNPGLAEIDRLRDRFGVSIPAMAYRLRSLEMISEWHFKSISVQISERGLRTEEHKEIRRERSVVWPRVFTSLRNSGELADFCSALGMHGGEIADLTFRSFVAAVQGGANSGAAAPPTARLSLVGQGSGGEGTDDSGDEGLQEWTDGVPEHLHQLPKR